MENIPKNKDEEEILTENMVNESERPNQINQKESVFAVGEERFEKIGNSISKGKDRVVGFLKNTGAKIGGFLKRIGRGAAVGLLSSPEIVERGANYYADKVSDGVEWVEGNVKKAGNKIVEGAEYYADKVSDGAEWTEGKIKKGIKNTTEFIDDGVELAKDTAFYVKEKTKEGFEKVTNGISNRYNSLVEFGKDTIDNAREKAVLAKKHFNNWRNEVRQMRLQKELDKDISKIATELNMDQDEVEKRKRNMEILQNRLNELMAQKQLLEQRVAA